jgi:hypothetical protein
LELTQLLTVAPTLTEEALQRLLEHDKWRLEAQFAHEIKLEEIRIASRRGGSSASQIIRSAEQESGVVEEDRKFNELSSYGVCTNKHIGLIAKTKIWEGTNACSSKLFEQWYGHIQDNNIIPLKDLKEGRIKTLLLAFLWASGCSHRIAKWPEAADSHLIETLKKDLGDRFSKFSKHSIVAAYESLKVFWREINDYEQCPFNSTLIADILDEAYTYVNQKATEESKVDIKNSPLFSEFEKQFPHVQLTTLERYYAKNRYNFVAAGVGALRKAFTTLCPSELEHKFSRSEWPKKWHQYIASYEPKWQKQLTQIQQETKEAQERWKEA